MFRVFMVAALATFLLSDLAAAQQYSRRGRFLQRVRQEIFGAKPSSPTPSEKSSQKTPTPSQSSTKYSQYTPKSQPKKPTRPTSTISSRKSSIQSNPQRKTSSSGRKGFGFSLVENKDDQLVVANVIPNSNAFESGLRRGDRVVEIGGIEANSIEEFEEISKVMNNGDQMEFSIKRNGSEKDLMITFGEMPEPEELELNESSATKSDRRFDFAPPQKNSGDSVLESAPRRSPNANSIGQRQPSRTEQSGNIELQQLRNVIQRQNYQIRQLQAEISKLKRFGR